MVSISTCSLDRLLNSYVSSKEKYVAHIFSDNFYFGQSPGIFFLTSFFFFPQSFKKFSEFPQGKSFRYFFVCVARHDPDNIELSCDVSVQRKRKTSPFYSPTYPCVLELDVVTREGLNVDVISELNLKDECQ